jgi:hypothetical protein
MIETPPDEIEGSEVFAMRDEDVTLWDKWGEDGHIAPGTMEVRSVGFVVYEEPEASEEIFQ